MSISPSGNLAIQLPSTPASSMQFLPLPRSTDDGNSGGAVAEAAAATPAAGGSTVGRDGLARRPSARQEKLDDMLRRLREVLPTLQVGTSGSKVAAPASASAAAVNPTSAALPSPAEVVRQAKVRESFRESPRSVLGSVVLRASGSFLSAKPSASLPPKNQPTSSNGTRSLNVYGRVWGWGVCPSRRQGNFNLRRRRQTAAPKPPPRQCRR